MDSINSSKITASSILNSPKSNDVKKTESKSIETNDSFVKSTEVEADTKLDFVKKTANQPLDVRDGKTFLKAVAFSTGVGALTGCIVGGGLGASPLIAAGIGVVAGGLIGGIAGGATAVGRAKDKVVETWPVEQHSVEYESPEYKKERVFAGKIPTNYYVSGSYDYSRETPFVNSYLTLQNPILAEDGTPKMGKFVKNSEGKGEPVVTWKTYNIKMEAPTMTYSESISEDYHYKKVFSHYETREERYISGYDGHGHPVYSYKTVTSPVFRHDKITDGFQHSFSPNSKSEKIGEYKTPTIKWEQKVDLNEASLIARDALLGAGLGAASGAIAGTALAFASPFLF